MSKRSYIIALCCGVAVIPAAHAQSSETPAQAQSAETTADKQLGDIIVTASRRSDTIKNTPTAVTAFTADALRQAHAASLADLAASTPNVQISTYNTNANVTIRGIGNPNINAGADAGVAVHQDGVYLGRSPLILSTLLDVERVEILRGPQGTLFGRNATGGAVNIIPNRPTDELHYGVDASFGLDPSMLRSSAYVSGPLSDHVRGRLAVGQNYNRGFTKNLNPTGPRRLDDVDSSSIRAQLEGDTGNLTARLSLEYQKDKGSGPSAWFGGTPEGTSPVVQENGTLVSLSTYPTNNLEKREVYANVGAKDVEAKFATLVTNLKLGGGDLKGTFSVADSDLLTLQDGDGTGANHTTTLFHDVASQKYGELIYTSDASKPFNFVIGTNYFHENLQQDVSVPISYLQAPLNFGPVSVDLGGVIKTTSYAGFGQGQYNFTDSFKVFAGMRYTHDKKEIAEYNNFSAFPSLATPRRDSASWSRVTYEFGTSYKFSPNVTAYAKYATGFKGGGYSAGATTPAFNPETNTNIEVGLKGTYLDGLLSANLSAFRMKYKDLQLSQVTGALTSVTNAARATIKGIEGEFVARPSKDFRIDLNAAWLDAKFDEFFTSDAARPTYLPDTKVINGVPTPGIQLAGHPLPQAPKYTVSVGGYYDIAAGSGTVTLGARYNWKSRVYFSEFSVPVSAQNATGKLDLSLNYKSEDRRWSASIFALNVTNEQVKQNVVIVSALIGSIAVTQYQPARQIGASIGYHF